MKRYLRRALAWGVFLVVCYYVVLGVRSFHSPWSFPRSAVLDNLPAMSQDCKAKGCVE
jgi:hypothetical protein